MFPELDIVTAFTPNDDGVNDTWDFVSHFYSEIRISVFNRNSRSVFECSGKECAWDVEWEGPCSGSILLHNLFERRETKISRYRNIITMKVFVKHVLIFSLLFAGAYRVLAQEDDYTQYYLNLPAMNAAYTGMDDYLNVNTGVREGWNNFGVENSNLYLSAYGTLNSASRSGRRNNSLRTSNLRYLMRCSPTKNSEGAMG